MRRQDLSSWGSPLGRRQLSSGRECQWLGTAYKRSANTIRPLWQQATSGRNATLPVDGLPPGVRDIWEKFKLGKIDAEATKFRLEYIRPTLRWRITIRCRRDGAAWTQTLELLDNPSNVHTMYLWLNSSGIPLRGPQTKKARHFVWGGSICLLRRIRSAILWWREFHVRKQVFNAWFQW